MRATTHFSANWLIACVNLVNPYGYVFHRQLPRSLRPQTRMRYRTGAVCRFSFPTGNTALGSIDGGDCGGRSGFCCRGEPRSGAIRYRGMLRIVGTFIGSIAGLTIIIAMIRAPFLMLTVCCIWAGFCTGFLRSSVWRTLMPGTGRLYGADYCCDDPERTAAGPSVCR